MFLYYDIDNSFTKLIEDISIKSAPLNISYNQKLLSYEDYLLLSTYHTHKPTDYTYRLIRQIRALGHQCVIGLLTFEKENSLYPKLDTIKGLQIFRMPLPNNELNENIVKAAHQISFEDINFAIEKSQEEYIDNKLIMLKHGKEHELLNTTLNPLRAMCMNVLTGITTMEKWNTMRAAILNKIQNNPEYSELFLIAGRINYTHQKHYPVKLFFNKLILSLNKQIEISQMTTFIAEIDALAFDFDSLFK